MKLYGAPGDVGNERAAAIKSEIVEDHRTVLHYKAQAVKEKDAIKITCIDEKLVLMLPHMNIADTLIARIHGAEGAAQDPIVTELEGEGRAVREQREAAAQCVDVRQIVSEASNSFAAPDMPLPSDPIPDPTSYTEPPGYASPDH